jgi:hypothetical protein
MKRLVLIATALVVVIILATSAANHPLRDHRLTKQQLDSMPHVMDAKGEMVIEDTFTTTTQYRDAFTPTAQDRILRYLLEQRQRENDQQWLRDREANRAWAGDRPSDIPR